MMRTGKVVLAVVTAAIVSAGCGGPAGDGDGVAIARTATATPAASPSATRTFDGDAPLKFAQCMREQGMTWFPDPNPAGGTAIRVPKGMDPKKFEKAQQACREFAPDGGDAAEANPEMIEMGRRMAKCMRENGVPDFPDPQPNGSIRLDRGKISSGPGDPAFDKAEQKCSQFQPQGRAERGGVKS